MTSGPRVGLLGGTLDPIHLGHIETATAARTALGLDRVHVLPSNVPPHRTEQPLASGYHRFAMTALAVNGIEGLLASDLELTAPGRSYTSDTLTLFRRTQGLDASQIFFITGADAFAEIATWHRYPEVLDLANFIVVSRPGFPAESLRERLRPLSQRMVSVLAGREPRPFDKLRVVPSEVEGRTASRESRQGSVSIFLVDARTPDVSSTDIRRRLAEGRSIRGLVPEVVERHIAQHGLYSTDIRSFAADHLHDQD
jgi:nicotinate-nucleotide adenylyltransferase